MLAVSHHCLGSNPVGASKKVASDLELGGDFLSHSPVFATTHNCLITTRNMGKRDKKIKIPNYDIISFFQQRLMTLT